MKKKKASWGFDVANLDRRVRPQDDFFRYANGGWLKKNKIPPDESRWGSFYVLRKKSSEALHEILRDSVHKKVALGSNLQKVRDFYLSGMNQKKLTKDGTGPLNRFFEMIDAAASPDDIISLSAYFRTIGVNALWGVGADQDMKDKSVVRLYINQGGLGLPDRDYYLKMDNVSVRIRKKYVGYIENMHKLAGFKTNLKKTVDTIMSIETSLARASMTQVELRDYEKQYNKISLSGLKHITPAIDWKKYFERMRADVSLPLIVSQPQYVKEAGRILKSVPLDDWQAYLKWKVIDSLSPYLSEKLVSEKFNFHGKVLSGTKKMKPRWERVTSKIDGSLGEALGQMYVEKHFKPEAKKEINELVDNLIDAYRERIKALDWMSSNTKKKALKKLKAFTRKLGYPDKWKSYAKLNISSDSYLENHINAYQFEFFREIKKIGRRPNKKEWGMTPSTVNAYNNYLFNEVVFPAGIMQPPFFDPDADDAVNYGAIGAVIGHEFTHGFDDKGGTFDKNGEMKNWWAKEDKKRFEAKAKKLIAQFDKYEILPGVFINGKLTIGENIADLGGLVIAFHAYQKAVQKKERKIIGGFTPEQRFFLGAAYAECGQAREAALRQQINTDPHSPSKARVNLPLTNMTEFYEAFGVKEGDKMWKPEKDRVVIW
ncbi:MAG: M13 family metallopeptidase [bacterium]|nr:M13 family metallopeptidase [bacterium]